MPTITIPPNARLSSVRECEDRITVEIAPIDWRAEARKLGFVKGANCLTHEGVRTIMTDRLGVDGKGNVYTKCPHPFFLRLGGRWVAEVLKPINKKVNHGKII